MTTFTYDIFLIAGLLQARLGLADASGRSVSRGGGGGHVASPGSWFLVRSCSVYRKIGHDDGFLHQIAGRINRVMASLLPERSRVHAVGSTPD